ncbi:4'-phosphopantetheinyl transferase superfamily protein [Streptacidiphilus sp. N1-12]|uniref:4'-phosphopantetheinyl transferase superfamily protein n=2 Tax=Streptacidiphilus alkalitolerans TaxID=3342712 RepID=A0ABV6VDG7_9ACTN
MSPPTDHVDRGDRIDFWVIPADQPAPVVARLRLLLDRTELDRAAAATDPVRADRFSTVHGVVRLLTAERLGIAPAELVWSYGPHGKPEPVTAADDRLQLSYSASGTLAVLALAEGRRVGADVEELRDERVATRLAGRYFPRSDQRFVCDGTPSAVSDRFTRLWCRREAVVKVYGGRLAQGLGLPLAGTGPLLLPTATPLDQGPCRVQDVPVPGAFRAAVAAEGAADLAVRHRLWTAPASLLEPHQPLQHSST